MSETRSHTDISSCPVCRMRLGQSGVFIRCANCGWITSPDAQQPGLSADSKRVEKPNPQSSVADGMRECVSPPPHTAAAPEGEFPLRVRETLSDDEVTHG